MRVAMLMKHKDGVMWALHYDLSDPSRLLEMIFKMVNTLAQDGRIEILTSEQFSAMEQKEQN